MSSRQDRPATAGCAPSRTSYVGHGIPEIGRHLHDGTAPAERAAGPVRQARPCTTIPRFRGAAEEGPATAIRRDIA
jgi:hypothetical protein